MVCHRLAAVHSQRVDEDSAECAFDSSAEIQRDPETHYSEKRMKRYSSIDERNELNGAVVVAYDQQERLKKSGGAPSQWAMPVFFLGSGDL